MSAPKINLITSSSLIGIVPQFTANVTDNHFAAANNYANDLLRKLIPSELFTRLSEVYNLATWSNSTAYTTGQEIVYNQRGYVALQNGTNKNPETETDYWEEIEIYSVYRDYIKPYLCWQAYNNFLIYHGVLVSQGGIKKHIDINAEDVSQEEKSRAIKRAQEMADNLFIEFKSYMDDNSNTIDTVVYSFNDNPTFKPKFGIHIVKMIILLVCFTKAYGQYPTPIVNEAKNYHFTKTVYIDGKLKVGYPTPTVARDIHFVADTIRLEGLDGTGSYLGIDVNGDVVRTTIGGGGVSGLNQYEILFGSSTGTIDQSSNLQWSDGFGSDILYITGTSPMIDIREGSLIANYTSANMFLTDGSGAAMDIQYNMVKYIDDDNGSVSIFKTDDNLGTVYDLYLPAAQGASNTFLKNDGSGNLTWAAASGETNTASNLGGGLANYDSKSGVDLRFNSFNSSDFNLASNLISLDYSNGQKATTSTIGFLTDTDWDTFNDKVGLVQAPIELSAQTASITTSNTAYTTPASDGYYRVTITAVVTTAAGSSMDLSVQLRYTEATDNVIKIFPTANVNNYNRTQTNSTGASVSISSVCHVKASTAIKYYTTWSPVGGSPQYNIHITVEKIY